MLNNLNRYEQQTGQHEETLQHFVIFIDVVMTE
jgi:hypothetical protein